MNKRLAALLPVTGMVLLTVRVAAAGPPGETNPVTPKPPRHQGFFIRGAIGPATHTLSTISRAENGGSPLVGGLIVDLQAGWTAFTRTAIHGGIILEPLDIEAGLAGIAVGATRFFPRNLSITATLGILTLGDEAGDGNSEGQPVVHLSAGKEWWLGENLGLGIGIRFVAGQVEGFPGSYGDRFAEDTNIFGVAILATATYN